MQEFDSAEVHPWFDPSLANTQAPATSVHRDVMESAHARRILPMLLRVSDLDMSDIKIGGSGDTVAFDQFRDALLSYARGDWVRLFELVKYIVNNHAEFCPSPAGRQGVVDVMDLMITRLPSYASQSHPLDAQLSDLKRCLAVP